MKFLPYLWFSIATVIPKFVFVISRGNDDYNQRRQNLALTKFQHIFYTYSSQEWQITPTTSFEGFLCPFNHKRAKLEEVLYEIGMGECKNTQSNIISPLYAQNWIQPELQSRHHLLLQGIALLLYSRILQLGRQKTYQLKNFLNRNP